MVVETEPAYEDAAEDEDGTADELGRDLGAREVAARDADLMEGAGSVCELKDEDDGDAADDDVWDKALPKVEVATLELLLLTLWLSSISPIFFAAPFFFLFLFFFFLPGLSSLNSE